MQGKMGDVDTMIQNVYMYVDSMVCNGLILFFSGELFTALSGDNVAYVQWIVTRGMSHS